MRSGPVCAENNLVLILAMVTSMYVMAGFWCPSYLLHDRIELKKMNNSSFNMPEG